MRDEVTTLRLRARTLRARKDFRKAQTGVVATMAAISVAYIVLTLLAVLQALGAHHAMHP